jgi:hypothetical protein
MERKNAIKLSSSDEILFRCDSDFFDNTLVSLLEEGYDKGLENKDKILISYEILPRSFKGECPDESDLVFKQKTISYGELKRGYKRWFGEEYSPEVEEKRSDFQMAVMEKQAQRRSAWGAYMQTIKILDAIEEEREEQRLTRKGDKEGLEKLKEKQDKRKRNNLLQIA